MRLEQAIKIGKENGIDDVGECVKHISYNAMHLFPYGKLEKEMDELYREYGIWRMNNENLQSDAEKSRG